MDHIYLADETSPFYVPDRLAERLRFGMAACFVAVLPFGPSWGGLDWIEIALPLSSFLLSIALVLDGLRLRRHRIKRKRAVEKLWANVSRSVE